MHSDSMPDEHAVYRCGDDEGGDSVSSDDYGSDSDADSPEVDN
jgi:hypothetical protein